LRKFGVERASALVVTMDSPNAVERVVSVAHEHWPDLAVYARARDVDQATRLIAQGASHAVPETTEASLQLSEMVLMGAGIPDRAARGLVEDRRQAEQAAVDESREQRGEKS
jgi:CPA2 family monovalent cation:H+ antiporter-2